MPEVKIPLTENEHKKIKSNAAKEGLPMTKYLRGLIFKKRRKKTPQQQIDEINFILSTKGATMTAEERAELKAKRKELKKQI